MSATHTLLQTHRPGAEPLRVLAASGQLGFGIPEQALARGMERQPHFIGCDMGSIDPGPYYLGSGEMAAPAQMVRRDLALVLRAARQADIPLIIGSAGTAGAAPQLQATVELLRDIAREERLDFRLCTVASDVPAELVLQAMTEDRLTAIGPMPVPQPHEVLACTHIVGQCGVETLQSALRELPDVLVAGRCCDTSIFAALPIMLGYPAGLSLQMAKIVECTSLCCQPSGRDAMLAELTLQDFTLESMNPQAHATPASVAAHALYEQSDPFTVEEPSGTLMLQQARYDALDAHRTRVSGAGFAPRARPSLKLEGSARVGARVVLLAGVADPLLLGRLTQVLSEVEGRVRGLVAGDWALHSHCYGQGAVRPLPVDQRSAHEAGLVLEFMADSRELARTAAGVFKQNLLHFSYPGRLSTGGNLAFAFTPSELDANDAYRFVLYHVMQDAPMEAIFRIESSDIRGSAASFH
jgi:Acyclic terpene utilisation family protein AtuA